VTGSHWPPRPHGRALVREIDRRHFETLALDVFPDVHLGPIRKRKDAHVFTGIHTGVVDVPDFGALVFRIPLPELIAKAEEALLGTRFFLVAPGAANGAVELKFLERRKERGNLQAVAADFTRRRYRDAPRRWRPPLCE